jgi:hypothetical protein
MSLIKAIYFDNEASKVIEEHFSKGKWGFQKLSKLLSNYLIEYIRNKQTLDNLELKEKEIKDKLNKTKEDYEIEMINREQELKDLYLNRQKVLSEINLKFVISEIEASFLNDTYDIIIRDKNKLKPRLQYFNNKFKKFVTEEEFLELIKKSRKEFPNSKNFIVEELNGR